MSQTYLTTKALSKLLSYSEWTIRNQLKDSVLLEGVHYIRPFGGRKILFIWEKIEEDMQVTQSKCHLASPCKSMPNQAPCASQFMLATHASSASLQFMQAMPV